MTAPGQDDQTVIEFSQDGDETIIAGSPPGSEPPKKRAPWLWIALAGLAMLFCLAAVGVGAALVSTQGKISFWGGKTPQTTESPTVTPDAAGATVTPTATEAQDSAPPTPTASPPTEEPATPGPSATQKTDSIQVPTSPPKASATSEAETRPFIGPITFANGATEDGKPVGASDTFTGEITEIHAVFTYKGMVDGTPWERGWQLEGNTVGSGSGVWDKGSSGVYHLSLNNGGRPLDAGNWEMEIYVDGEMLRSGQFVIKSGAEPTDLPHLLPTERPVATPTGESGTTPTTEPKATPVVPAVAGTHEIAFSRWDGGRHNLFIAETDGSEEVPVWQRAAGPSWSPDGQFLYAYGTEGVDRQEREGTGEVAFEGVSNGIIRLDMSGLKDGFYRIFQDPGWKEGTGRATALSPNGDMLAFGATRGGDWRIYFLGTFEPLQFNVEILGEQVDWSPDGNKLVYRSGRDNRQGIWVSNRDDSGAVNITSDGSDAFPRWSPDGRKIAFHREAGGNVDIYLMNTDGNNIRRLTDAPGPDTLPAWTPDGRIVFRSARSGSWAIYIMNADSSDQKQILANTDPGPDWAFGRMDVH